MVDRDEEIRLIALARDGDTEAFAQLVRAHELAVRRLAAGLLADPVEAEDAAQEVFLRAHRSLRAFRGDAAFGTWLHRITVNHCRDLLRARARRPWLSWDALTEAFGGDPPTPAADPAAATRGPEGADLLRALLDRLPADYREVLLLREVNGLSYREIADTLECSLDAVKARLRRARDAAVETARHLGR